MPKNCSAKQPSAVAVGAPEKKEPERDHVRRARMHLRRAPKQASPHRRCRPQPRCPRRAAGAPRPASRRRARSWLGWGRAAGGRRRGRRAARHGRGGLLSARVWARGSRARCARAAAPFAARRCAALYPRRRSVHGSCRGDAAGASNKGKKNRGAEG